MSLDQADATWRVDSGPATRTRKASSAHAAFVPARPSAHGVAGVVVHGHVDEVDNRGGGRAEGSLRVSANPGRMRLPRTLRDATEFLDIQVNQRARTGMLVANDLPCGAVEPCDGHVKPESADADTSVDGGASDAQLPPDAVAVPRQAYARAAQMVASWSRAVLARAA